MTTPEERAATAETALAEALARVAALEEALRALADRVEDRGADKWMPHQLNRARAALRGPGA